MSSSARLRRTHTEFGGGRGIRSDESVSLEKRVQDEETNILATLRERYPMLAFSHTKRLSKETINRKLRDLHHTFGVYQSNSNAHIKPDGGLFWAKLPDGSNELILVMEAKKQGTNDQRLAEGKREQSKGNALERSCKNFLELENYLYDKLHFPFLIMVSGDDLKEDSSIRDRITSLIRGSAPNHYYVAKTPTRYGLFSRASVFMRKEEWSSEEILEHALAVATASIDLLLQSTFIGTPIYDHTNSSAGRFRLFN